MNDTRPEAKMVLDELFNNLSGEQRLLMGLKMFETAREIVISSLPKGLPEKELRKELFLRFYGDEFTKQEIGKIFKRIDEYFA
jgi:hypothetical protein